MILDTTVLVDLLRADPEAVKKVRALEEDGTNLWIPTPALFELWEGIERADRPLEERERVAALVAGYTVLEFSSRHAARAGTISGELIRQGRMIDPVDAQIAGTALETGTALLTRNEKHFKRIADLDVTPY